jgi:hypothetical protein
MRFQKRAAESQQPSRMSHIFLPAFLKGKGHKENG